MTDDTTQTTWISIGLQAHGLGRTQNQALAENLYHSRAVSGMDEEHRTLRTYKVKGNWEIDGMGALQADEILEEEELQITPSQARAVQDSYENVKYEIDGLRPKDI